MSDAWERLTRAIEDRSAFTGDYRLLIEARDRIAELEAKHARLERIEAAARALVDEETTAHWDALREALEGK